MCAQLLEESTGEWWLAVETTEDRVTNGAATVDDMNEQSDACVADGREPVDVQVYTQASDSNLAVLSGQADVLAHPSETAGYAAQ